MNYFEQTKLGESRWWSWVSVTAITFFAWFIFSIFLSFPLMLIAGSLDLPLFEATPTSDGTDTTDPLLQLMGASPIAYAIFLLTFPAALTGLYFGQKLIHSRTLTLLHTAAARFRWMRVFRGFFLTWIVLGAFAAVGNALGLIDVEYVFSGGRFWMFALVSLLLIPIQSATEEIVFRGYFNQGLHLSHSWPCIYPIPKP